MREEVIIILAKSTARVVYWLVVAFYCAVCCDLYSHPGQFFVKILLSLGVYCVRKLCVCLFVHRMVAVL